MSLRWPYRLRRACSPDSRLLTVMSGGAAALAFVASRPIAAVLAASPAGFLMARSAMRGLALESRFHLVLDRGPALCRDDLDQLAAVGEFDQDNRLLSHVGPIHGMEVESVAEYAFRPRARNRVTLVPWCGGLAIRKSFPREHELRKEVVALDALRDLPRVPRVEAVDVANRSVILSLLPGGNLGSLMDAAGLSTSDQFRLTCSYAGTGRWADNDVAELRERALDVFSRVVPSARRDEILSLYAGVHAAGVVIGDIKYGNVLIEDHGAALCDFSAADMLAPGSRTLRKRVRAEQDCIRFLFGDPTS